MEPFVFGAAGDDFYAGKMAGGPGDLLRLGPSSVRAAGENDGIQVRDGFIEAHGVGHEWKIAVKIVVAAEALPECFGSESVFGFA